VRAEALARYGNIATLASREAAREEERAREMKRGDSRKVRGGRTARVVARTS